MTTDLRTLQESLIASIKEMDCEQQYQIAQAIAANVGYKLVSENYNNPRRTVTFTEANGRQITILVPLANIEYIQSPVKDGGDTHIRLKAGRDGHKYFFAKESVQELEAQINAS